MRRSAALARLSGFILIANALVWPAAAQPPVPSGPGSEAPGSPPPQSPPPEAPPPGPSAPGPSGTEQPGPTGAGQPGQYEFAAPPGQNFNRVYGVNRATGQINACQYQSGGGVGTTLCFGSGEGAGPQAAGDYGLVATNLRDEGGIFRVNRRTGEMSICYVQNSLTVCTAPRR